MWMGHHPLWRNRKTGFASSSDEAQSPCFRGRIPCLQTWGVCQYIQADYKWNILTDCPWADDVFESKLCKVQDLDFSDISEHRIRKIFEKETLEDPDFSRMLDQFLLQFKFCKSRFS